MNGYLGDFSTGATVRVPWNASGADGASITRGTDGSIRIYKDGNTTQRTSSAGITDSEDFDSLTGVNIATIDLSDNTDAGFYAAGHDYMVVIQGAGIDGKTVNAVIGAFSIQNRYAGAAPSANAIAAAILDLTDGIETGYTLRQALRLILAAEAGKVSGAGGTTVTIRDVTDSKNRIVATVDANGNRTAVTKDVS